MKSSLAQPSTPLACGPHGVVALHDAVVVGNQGVYLSHFSQFQLTPHSTSTTLNTERQHSPKSKKDVGQFASALPIPGLQRQCSRDGLFPPMLKADPFSLVQSTHWLRSVKWGLGNTSQSEKTLNLPRQHLSTRLLQRDERLVGRREG